jgi:hypothetical protein
MAVLSRSVQLIKVIWLSVTVITELFASHMLISNTFGFIINCLLGCESSRTTEFSYVGAKYTWLLLSHFVTNNRGRE